MTTGSAIEKLAATVERIFADGVMDAAEKTELKALFAQGALTVPQVRDVLSAFVRDTWGEVMEDGVLTDAERAKLKAVVRELKLPDDCIPEAVRRVVSE